MHYYSVSNYLLFFKPASFNKNAISGHKFLANILKVVICQLPCVSGGRLTQSQPVIPSSSKTMIKGKVLTQSSHSGVLGGKTEAHLALIDLWFPLKQVVLHTSYYSCKYVTSWFHFVSNLISLKAKPRYWFFVNILDPTAPKISSKKAWYIAHLKLGTNKHVLPSPQPTQI